MYLITIENNKAITRNIAKSGGVLNWSGFGLFGLHLNLTENRS